ncbi:MAG: hypothetical protein ACXVAY_20025 [Mucilaginibacter sp.]
MKYFALVFLLFITVSCSFTYKIPDNDYSLIPYKGDETLAFKSNTGETDTVFLEGINRYSGPRDQWHSFWRNAEYYEILSERTDPVYPERRLIHQKLITMVYDGETTISIDFTAKNAWFYGPDFYPKKEFLQLKTNILIVNKRKYDDVLVLKPNAVYNENINGKIVERSNTITKLYWSRKYGIVRYDKIGTEYWELSSVTNQ